MPDKQPKLADDCFVHDKDRLRHDEALTILKEHLSPIVVPETISLDTAHGRVLAEPITAPRNIPAFDNSAVDGYAFASADYEATGGFFPLTARIAAGDTEQLEIPANSAARIFTGAKMPAGADTIAMQEDCENHDQDGASFVAIPPGLKLGANRRLAGEDVSAGSQVAEPGEVLKPQDIAAIASTGIDQISAFKRLRIAVISSGNELLRPGEPFEDGKVYDSNHFMMSALLKNTGAITTDLGICPDNADTVHKTLKSAASSHDVVITSGGASKGEEDHLIEALDELGTRHLWQLAIKPGRPMSFGTIDNTVVFALPGNPVAAFICFLLYVKPSLGCLAGAQWRSPKRFPLPAGFEIPHKKPDRREFLRGILETDDQGQTVLKKFQRDGSGLISGLRQADGLIEIPEEVTKIAVGEMLNFIPFGEFGLH